MENISKYIGIKHYFGESSFEKCDCIGLVKLFYRDHGWPQDFEDGKPFPTKRNYSSSAQWRRLFEYLLKNFDKVPYNKLQFGDVIVMNVGGSMHLGVYIGYGKVLGMEIPTKYGESESTIYSRRWWTSVFKYGFRRKEK